MIVLRCSMQWEDSIDHANGKCNVFTFLVSKRKIFSRILMQVSIFYTFSQLVGHCVT